jgi:hypothetical protein
MLPSNNSRMINELRKKTYSTLQYISSFNFFYEEKNHYFTISIHTKTQNLYSKVYYNIILKKS